MPSAIAPAPSRGSSQSSSTATADTAGFGLYLHWPYCAAKCPYCDFNSHVAGTIDHARWAAAYCSELRRAASETSGRQLDAIFFGGGTPSLMAPETVAAVLEEVRRLWPLAEAAEITLEANPTSVEAGRFRAFQAAGINRLSLGVQALDDGDLHRLGRRHTAREALQAFDIARENFSRVSFDLIYARQRQTPAAWAAELAKALRLAVDHLSLYQLTVEPGTPFWDRRARGGLAGLPDDDSAAEMYELTQTLCADAGLPAYEISNHARPGAESRHNLVYWRAGEWLGIGPGAHGRLNQAGRRLATETIRLPEAWLAAVEQTGSGERPRAILTSADCVAEMLIMGLRLTEGVALPRLERAGGQLDPVALDRLIGLGLVETAEGRLRTTPSGKPLLDAILRDLVPD